MRQTSRSLIFTLTMVLGLVSLGLAAQPAPDERRLFVEAAKLWPVYCAQCHNARPGSEFSPQQWDVIMMHMRTQANLPATDARAMTEYLKRSH